MNVLFFLSTEIFLKGSFLWLFLKSALKISPLIPALKKKVQKVGRSRTFLFLSSNRALSLFSFLLSLAVEVVASFCVVPLGGVSERGRQNVATRSAAHR